MKKEPILYGRCFGLKKFRATPKARQTPVSEWDWTPHLPEKASLSPETLPQWNQALETNYRPAETRQRVILIFEQAGYTEELIREVAKLGMKYFALDYTQLIGLKSIDVQLGKDDRRVLRVNGFDLDLRDVAAVLWCTPADTSFTVPEDHLHTNDHVNVERWRTFLKDLRWLLPEDTLWMPSHPLNGSNEWQNKFSELALAHSVGLHIPETICTDNPEIALNFVRKHKPNVMFREMILRSPRVGFDIEINNIDEKRIPWVANTPCIFQQFIPKQYELRTVLIGKKTYTAKINSALSQKARVNWKVYDNKTVSWENYRLPTQVSKALVKLSQKLDINWGSADLIRGLDGNYYFIEINRPGSQYWLLPFVGIDSAREVARYLQAELKKRT